MQWMDADLRDMREVPSLTPAPLKRFGVSHDTPGMIDGWAAGIIALACVVTPILIGAAMFLVWYARSLASDAPDPWLFCVVPPAFATGLMVLWLRRPAAVSRWIRAAVLIPMLHVALAVLAWWLWRTHASQIAYALTRLPLVDRVPAPTIALAVGLAVVAGALLPGARRRRGQVPRWLQFAVVFVMAHLLLLGLWLPMAAAGWSEPFGDVPFVELPSVEHLALLTPTTPQLDGFILIALLPPTVIAAGVAIAVATRPRWLAAQRTFIVTLLAIALAIALLCRLGTDYVGYVAYANLVHVLLSEAILCLLCIIALMIAHWRALRRTHHDQRRAAPWVQHGTVALHPGQPAQVARMEYLGWLGGLRAGATGFRLRTPQGLIDVPDGAHVIAPVPPWTTSAPAGAARAILQEGDPVSVSGYVAPPNQGVFRDAALPIPGTDGIVITASRAEHESIWRDVLLVVWRPCVFYLLVATVVALPGVVALALM